MSSGFVSGGTTDKPIERDDEWLKAQQEIETNHRRKEEVSRQEGGKTLYDVLQSNKAAKQDAFEESIRLKNQFRNLDEDEVEFLDSVLESTRKKEAEVKKQTSEQLDLFRRQQEEADKASLEAGGEEEVRGAKGLEEEEMWAVNKGKRKRVKERDGPKGFKLRKASSSTAPGDKGTAHGDRTPFKTSSSTPIVASQPVINTAAKNHTQAIRSTTKVNAISKVTPKPKEFASSSLGLAAYSSDEEE